MCSEGAGHKRSSEIYRFAHGSTRIAFGVAVQLRKSASDDALRYGNEYFFNGGDSARGERETRLSARAATTRSILHAVRGFLRDMKIWNYGSIADQPPGIPRSSSTGQKAFGLRAVIRAVIRLGPQIRLTFACCRRRTQRRPGAPPL